MSDKRYVFIVEPRHGFLPSPFPLDMLRYDSCWPAHQDDVAKIIHLTEARRGIHPLPENERRPQISLIGMKQPTLERWHSFAWQVTSSEVVRP